MTSSEIAMPGEVKADPAALMASLQLLPSPTPNLEIKYTKVKPSRGRFLEASSGSLQWPGSPEVACHLRASAETAMRASQVSPRLGGSAWGEPVPTRRQRGDRQRRRTVVTTSGLPEEVGFPRADLGLVLGSPTTL